MTVQVQTKKATATGNGSGTTFSFSPIVIFASTDLEVVTTVIATGVETARSEGTGDSAWSLGISTFPATGSITYPQDEVTPLPSTETITIRRVLTLEQQTDLQNQGGYFPEVQETQFDKLVMIDLQQQEEIDRSFQFPASYTGNVGIEVPAPITGDGGRVLVLNSALTGMEWGTVTTAALALPVTIANGGTGASTAATARTALDFTKGADIASATALTLGTDGNYFDVTGTTTITSIATWNIGDVVRLHFDDAVILTHHATNLILPGGANITTAAGDEFTFVEYGSGLWRCVGYALADGLPPVGVHTQGLQTIWVPAAAIVPRTTTGAARGVLESSSNKVTTPTLDFDASTIEYAQFQIAFPKNWDMGTVTAEVHWTAQSGSGTVIWGLQGMSLSNGGVMDSAYGTAIESTDTVLSAKQVHMIAIAAVTLAFTPDVGDESLFQVFRNAASGSDTLAVDANLLGINIFYTTNAKDDG